MKNTTSANKARLTIFLGLGVLLLSSPITSFAQCDYSLPASTPTGQFTAHGDGTVTDTKTGLTWKVCSEGQTWYAANRCGGNGAFDGVQPFSWDAAMQQARSVNNNGGFAGHADWRVPTIQELRSIQELSCALPSINTEVFGMPESNHARLFWSSTPTVSSARAANPINPSVNDERLCGGGACAWGYTFYAVPDTKLKNTRYRKETTLLLRLVRN